MDVPQYQILDDMSGVTDRILRVKLSPEYFLT
jgi:hypothetical protein